MKKMNNNHLYHLLYPLCIWFVTNNQWTPLSKRMYHEMQKLDSISSMCSLVDIFLFSKGVQA
jgi:hypothetical protein